MTVANPMKEKVSYLVTRLRTRPIWAKAKVKKPKFVLEVKARFPRCARLTSRARLVHVVQVAPVGVRMENYGKKSVK